jgi:hypothetical protein
MTIPACQSLLTAEDDDKYWKVMRAAAAQGFSTKNLKCELLLLLHPNMRMDGMHACAWCCIASTATRCHAQQCSPALLQCPTVLTTRLFTARMGWAHALRPSSLPASAHC